MPEPTVLTRVTSGNGTEPTNGHSNGHLQSDIIAATAALAEVTPPSQNGHKEPALTVDKSLPVEERLQRLSEEYALALHSQDPEARFEREQEIFRLLMDMSGSRFRVQEYADSLARYYATHDPEERERARLEYTYNLNLLRDSIETKEKSADRVANDTRDSSVRTARDDKRIIEPAPNAQEATAYDDPSVASLQQQDANEDAPWEKADIGDASAKTSEVKFPEPWETTSAPPKPRIEAQSEQPWLTKTVSNPNVDQNGVIPGFEDEGISSDEESSSPTQVGHGQMEVSENENDTGSGQIRTAPPTSNRHTIRDGKGRYMPAELAKRIWNSPGEYYSQETTESEPEAADLDQAQADEPAATGIEIPQIEVSDTTTPPSNAGNSSLELPSPSDLEEPELTAPQTILEKRKHLMMITTSAVAFSDRAKDLAAKQVTAELRLQKRDLLSPRRVIRMLSTRFNESGRWRYYEAMALRALTKTGNAYADIDLSRGSAKNAIVDPNHRREEFNQAISDTLTAINIDPSVSVKKATPAEQALKAKIMDQLIRPAVSATDDPTFEEIQFGVNEFIRDNREAFNQAFGDGITASEEFSVFLYNNIADKISAVREDLRVQRLALNELDEWIDIQMVTPRWGAQTEYIKSVIDRIVTWGESGRFKSAKRILLHPGVVATGATLGFMATSAIAKLNQAPAAFLATGGILGFVVAGMRKSGEIKSDRAIHQRERAQGEKYPTYEYEAPGSSAKSRIVKSLRESALTKRVDMQKFDYDTVTAREILEGSDSNPGLIQLIDADLHNPQKLDELLWLMADTDSRLKISLTEGKDLITYSSYTSIQSENLQLLLGLVRAKHRLRETGLFTPELESKLSDYTNERTKDIVSDIRASDIDFDEERSKEFFKAGAVGMGLGMGAAAAAHFIAIPAIRSGLNFIVEMARANGLDFDTLAANFASGVKDLFSPQKPNIDTASTQGFEIPKPPDDITITSDQLSQSADTSTSINQNSLMASINPEAIIDNDQTANMMAEQPRDVLGKEGIWREAAVDITDKTWDGRRSDEFFVGKRGNALIFRVPENADGVLIGRGGGNPIWIPKDGDGLVRLDPDSNKTFRSLRGDVVHMDDLAKMLVDQDELAKYENGGLRTEEFTNRRKVINADIVEAAKLDKTENGFKASVKATVFGDGQLPDQIITDNVDAPDNPPNQPDNPPVDEPGKTPKPDETPSPTEEPTVRPDRTPIPEITAEPSPYPTVEPTPEPSITPEPVESAQPVPTGTPSVSENPPPTISPEPSPSPIEISPSPEPTLSPTLSESPSPMPEPSGSPAQIATPEPSPEPTPRAELTPPPLRTPGPEPAPPPKSGNPFDFDPDRDLPKVATAFNAQRRPLEETNSDFVNAYVERYEKEKQKAEAAGLPYDYPKDKPAELGWQLHINADPDSTLGRRLIDEAKRWNLRASPGIGIESKREGMTIHVGDRDTAVEFADNLDANFGSEIPSPTEGMMEQDEPLTGKIGARFSFPGERIDSLKFDPNATGRSGINLIEDDAVRLAYKMAPNDDAGFALAARRAAAVLKGTYGAFFEGTGYRRYIAPGTMLDFSEAIKSFRNLPKDFQTLVGIGNEPVSQPNTNKRSLLGFINRRRDRAPEYVVAQPVGVAPQPVSTIATANDDDDSIAS